MRAARDRGLAAALILALSATISIAATRTAIVGEICDTASTMSEAGRTLVTLAADGTQPERAWGAAIAGAVMGRTMTCDGTGAVLRDGGSPRDAATLANRAAEGEMHAPTLNLRNRGLFELAQAALALTTSPDKGQRGAAIQTLRRRASDLPERFFETAAAAEKDRDLRQQIEALGQRAALASPDTNVRIGALGHIADHPNSRVLADIQALKVDTAYAADLAFRKAVDVAVLRVKHGIAIGDVLAALYSGISLASILFMAAIGLAVIFGLMGVINLAQGEMIMIGAYTTWLVQQGLRRALPELLDYYLIIAIPVAFIVTAAIGMALEAALLRHLYRRPLMSLLATWAVSLFLTNLVRVTFGTQNLDFVTPYYVTGGISVIGDFFLTWNRLFAIAFAAMTLLLTWAVVRLTPLGLNIRAVTQNRTMAACIGIPVRRVDMLAFGLGSGLAGLAGLALAPIYSVNPQMGQGFIIDSFMVVVLGGVGTIAGTVLASFGIGQINVLIEPIWGAVAAKVIVLMMIITFLQFRPEGLFTVRGKRK